jgi:peptide/nickel transport system permease protein
LSDTSHRTWFRRDRARAGASIREREFIGASRSLGASNCRFLFREILPTLLAPLIVYRTLLISVRILSEPALSFLGLGIRPPQAGWGRTISDASGRFNTGCRPSQEANR